jgi:hypothetical protein
MQHRVVGLEIERCERADFKPAVLLEFRHQAAAFGAHLDVFGRRQNGPQLDLAWRDH